MEKYKKAVLSQRWPRDVPNIWVPWKWQESTKSADICARISTLLQSYHHFKRRQFAYIRLLHYRPL